MGSFGEAFSEERTDWNKAFRKNQANRGKDEESTMFRSMTGTHPLIAFENTGLADTMKVRENMGLRLEDQQR